ncbi:hypothetical protein SAMN06297280_3443 [Arsukibacterium tuosuense]|uniref:Uncharacterized protein n=1 Tax=Arsukibacterium tuosuense TaxID=1323745 RepID=A0A285JGT5_9GAMM|nr:hypothetical protein [Arsukibacterium tuosuense]SNY58596.1 hypothetical protein SAMN06297280_3443 [Arsukibacterium tuosuense]
MHNPQFHILISARSWTLHVFAFILLGLVLSGCTARSSIDSEGRLYVNHFGIMKVLSSQPEQNYIDLRDASMLGFFSDGNLTIGYKKNKKGEIHLGCRALILTSENTDHESVVRLISRLDIGKLCQLNKEDSLVNPQPYLPLQKESIQVGLTTLTQSLTYSNNQDVKAYSNSFIGVGFGEINGIGYRKSSVVAAGNHCKLLLVTSTESNFNYYKNTFEQLPGEQICLALAPY